MPEKRLYFEVWASLSYEYFVKHKVNWQWNEMSKNVLPKYSVRSLFFLFQTFFRRVFTFVLLLFLFCVRFAHFRLLSSSLLLLHFLFRAISKNYTLLSNSIYYLTCSFFTLFSVFVHEFFRYFYLFRRWRRCCCRFRHPYNRLVFIRFCFHCMLFNHFLNFVAISWKFHIEEETWSQERRDKQKRWKKRRKRNNKKTNGNFGGSLYSPKNTNFCFSVRTLENDKILGLSKKLVNFDGEL